MTSLKTTAIHAHTDLGWRPDLRSPLVLGLLALLSLQLLLALFRLSLLSAFTRIVSLFFVVIIILDKVSAKHK